MKRSYSDLEQHTGDPPFAFGPGVRGSRQPKQYQQQTEPGTGKIKACMQCGTTRTPQWREGPYGPKTLCNACGVKRVRAIKAQQQGKNPGQVAHTGGAGGKKKSAAAARTESIELATTLQLLAGNLEAGPPAAKRQARVGHMAGPGRGRKAASLQAVPTNMPEYDPFDPAAAAAMSAPALGSAVQKAIAAIAAKGSVGGESNPTDSGEEISWSPNDHQQAGDALAAAAAEGAGGRRQRMQQQQLRAAMAAAAAAQLQSAVAAEQEELMHLPGLSGQPLDVQQQLEASLAESYGAGATETAPDGTAAAADEEAAAVANLLSMSAATDQQQTSGAAGASLPTSSAGKSAMRDLVAALTANTATASSKSPARRQATRTSPPRHVVTVGPRQRGAAAAAAATTTAPTCLLEDEEVLYLLGPGMPVVARYVAPEELLEVIKLNELASEAQRSRAAAEAAVEAVEQILRDKQAAALAAQTAARAAMQHLHSFVGELNAQHGLMMKAAQEQQQQQPAGLASQLTAGRVGSLMHLDLLAASLQQQQHQQLQEQEQELDPEQQHAIAQQEQGDGLAGLAAAAAAAAQPDQLEQRVAKIEPVDVCAAEHDQPTIQGGVMDGQGVAAGDVAAATTAAAGDVDASAAVDASGAAAGIAAVAGRFEAFHDVGAQQTPSPDAQQLSQLSIPLAPSTVMLPEAAAAAGVPTPEELEVQAAQLLGSFQELAAIAGLSNVTGADNNGVAMAASPAIL